MIRHFIVYVSVFLVLVSGAAAMAGEAQFFSSIQDMPIKAGLRELPDQTVMFDKPEGRIIESVAEVVSGTQDEVFAYYEITLPQLGWRKTGEHEYVRDAEILRLGFEKIEGQGFLRIMVRPR